LGDGRDLCVPFTLAGAVAGLEINLLSSVFWDPGASFEMTNQMVGFSADGTVAYRGLGNVPKGIFENQL